MQLQVRPDHLEIVREILKRHVPDRAVWAFGSRVAGTAKTTSDLDLAIAGHQPLDFGTLAALRDDFSDASLPYRVDVIDLATVTDSFRRIIETSRLPIQQATAAEC
jgi:type I restriction enzyme S subunit